MIRSIRRMSFMESRFHKLYPLMNCKQAKWTKRIQQLKHRRKWSLPFIFGIHFVCKLQKMTVYSLYTVEVVFYIRCGRTQIYEYKLGGHLYYGVASLEAFLVGFPRKPAINFILSYFPIYLPTRPSRFYLKPVIKFVQYLIISSFMYVCKN